MLLRYFMALQLTLISFVAMQAQDNIPDRSSLNYLYFQNKPYYFGITLGYNNSSFKVFRGQKFINNDSIINIVSPHGHGVNMGIVLNLKMGQDFDLRLLPTLSFADKTIEYITKSQKTVDKRIESVYLEFPVHVRYKSKVYHDFRMLVLGGIKYSFDMSSNSRSRQVAQLIKVAPNDFSLEVGTGIQIFLPYFMFTPEIKFSHSLTNSLLFEKDLIYSSILEKVLATSITLSFHFEG